jgi:hypothetical protein
MEHLTMGTGKDDVDSRNNDNNIINTNDDNLDLDLRILEKFCTKILQRDYFIKTVKISNLLGNILVEQKRMGGTNLIVEAELIIGEESRRAAAQAAIRAATRDQFRSKLGDLLFSTSRYEKEVRATIPIKDPLVKKNKFLVLLTFDVDADADWILYKKILPLIKENVDYFI